MIPELAMPVSLQPGGRPASGTTMGAGPRKPGFEAHLPASEPAVVPAEDQVPADRRAPAPGPRGARRAAPRPEPALPAAEAGAPPAPSPATSTTEAAQALVREPGQAASAQPSHHPAMLLPQAESPGASVTGGGKAAPAAGLPPEAAQPPAAGGPQPAALQDRAGPQADVPRPVRPLPGLLPGDDKALHEAPPHREAQQGHAARAAAAPVLLAPVPSAGSPRAAAPSAGPVLRTDLPPAVGGADDARGEAGSGRPAPGGPRRGAPPAGQASPDSALRGPVPEAPPRGMGSSGARVPQAPPAAPPGRETPAADLPGVRGVGIGLLGDMRFSLRVDVGTTELAARIAAEAGQLRTSLAEVGAELDAVRVEVAGQTGPDIGGGWQGFRPSSGEDGGDRATGWAVQEERSKAPGEERRADAGAGSAAGRGSPSSAEGDGRGADGGAAGHGDGGAPPRGQRGSAPEPTTALPMPGGDEAEDRAASRLAGTSGAAGQDRPARPGGLDVYA